MPLLQSAVEGTHRRPSGSVGLSSRFELELLADKLDRLGQNRGTKTEGALDNRASPRMSRVTLKADARPLRSARITSKLLIVA